MPIADDLLREVALSGAEDIPGLQYVKVQIDRETWVHLQHYVKRRRLLRFSHSLLAWFVRRET